MLYRSSSVLACAELNFKFQGSAAYHRAAVPKCISVCLIRATRKGQSSNQPVDQTLRDCLTALSMSHADSLYMHWFVRQHVHTESEWSIAASGGVSCMSDVAVMCVVAVPSARRAQTLIMPGTLPQHQASDALLASTSDIMASDMSRGGGVSGSGVSSGGISKASISSSTDMGLPHSSAALTSGSSTLSDDLSSSQSGSHSGSSSSSHGVSQSAGGASDTVRMGKMLESQPRSRSSAHHHTSATGR